MNYEWGKRTQLVEPSKDERRHGAYYPYQRVDQIVKLLCTYDYDVDDDKEKSSTHEEEEGLSDSGGGSERPIL